MKNKKLKTIPKFKNEDEERKFWLVHDSTEYINWKKAVKNPIFANLKPSTKTISLRLPNFLFSMIKQIARAKDVPYQSLMKIFLMEKVKEEYRSV